MLALMPADQVRETPVGDFHAARRAGRSRGVDDVSGKVRLARVRQIHRGRSGDLGRVDAENVAPLHRQLLGDILRRHQDLARESRIMNSRLGFGYEASSGT